MGAIILICIQYMAILKTKRYYYIVIITYWRSTTKAKLCNDMELVLYLNERIIVDGGAYQSIMETKVTNIELNNRMTFKLGLLAELNSAIHAGPPF